MTTRPYDLVPDKDATLLRLVDRPDLARDLDDWVLSALLHYAQHQQCSAASSVLRDEWDRRDTDRLLDRLEDDLGVERREDTA